MAIEYADFFTNLEAFFPASFTQRLSARTSAVLKELSHGDFDKWRKAIETMTAQRNAKVDLQGAAVKVSSPNSLNHIERATLRESLMQLHPWRKGPFELFGIGIDTEWRSDLKWARLAGHIRLKDKLVLDVGCGNGYYLFRMLGAGAKMAVGVDPFLLYVMQFHAINKYVRTNRATVLPLGVEDIPIDCGCFDTVFSMGILYHRRDPKEHLQQLRDFLMPGGQVVLETIVLDQAGEHLLVPQGFWYIAIYNSLG